MQIRPDLLSRGFPDLAGRDSARPLQVGAGGGFGETFTRVLNEVSDTREHAGDLTRRFAAGENVELHQVMAAGEEAGIALDLLVELRNKLVEAYRNVISLQS
jgi:flagellar hook-basal body complex protein FliE